MRDTPPNRLSREKSPYLLQHARNPVDWYPWGDEAFARARAEERPIFLSVGYATCHWCHVMERESFENREIAELLNTLFVPVKVDREERPDVDRLYMAALHAMGHNGGWPMSMFLTPDLKPFYGGTYFPPENRHNRAGFPHVLRKIADLWATERETITSSAATIIAHLQDIATAGGGGSVDPAPVAARCFEELAGMFDHSAGAGFGGAPKFPRPSVFHFLTRHYHRSGEREAADMTGATLQAMGSGGIHDHIGGGFHRYAVDAAWRVPHFEKMLYDQAGIAHACLDMLQLTREPVYERLVRGTIGYVLRDLTGPDGAFLSAEDADSPRPDAPCEHGEGAFYLWRHAEVAALLGADASTFMRAYGIEPDGNAPFDPGQEFTGTNILYRPEGIERGAADPALERSCRVLFEARTRRPRPLLDDKVLASWNGMMIGACARAGAVLDDPAFIHAALKAGDHALRHLGAGGSGPLVRRWRDGEGAHAAHLDDHMWMADGFLTLHAATGDSVWLDRAVALAERALRTFVDAGQGGFFDTDGRDPSVLVRMKERYDGAEPSGNAVAASVLSRLAALTGNSNWGDALEGVWRAFQPWLGRQPSVMPYMVATLEGTLVPHTQLVIAGPPADRRTRALEGEYWRRFLPDMVFIRTDGTGGDPVLERIAPFAAGLPMIDGTPAAYLCEDFACRLPVTEPADLGRLLDRLTRPFVPAGE